MSILLLSNAYAASSAGAFADVTSNSWYCDVVSQAVKSGLMPGIADDAWSADAMKWAAASYLTTGFDDAWIIRS